MVQRKAPGKLALQADHHHKTENLFRHQYVRTNRGADLKKMMKKSGSIKRPKQPAKSPPPAPPQKSPSVKTATTPNYMKPTTSSDARKEQSQSQASTKNPQTSNHSSKISLASGKIAKKALLGRTLTKNPSFKSVRRYSAVVLCENLDAQRATCSSTLKDCKFPTYLNLNPGGTESEGSSAVKVCPYTYCSLNGHHHAPLPPLKCFLSARRRTMRTQRSIKLGCLSPRRVKPVEDDPLIDKEVKNFFIEIYGKEYEDTADIAEVERDPSIIDDDETAVEDQEERVLETLSDAPICDDFGTREDQVIEVDKEISPPFLVEERNLDCLNEGSNFDELGDYEGSNMDWKKGYHSALNLDYDYDYGYSPATDLDPDPELDIGENRSINNEFMIGSEYKDWCFDESLVDDVSQESYEESLNSDAFSSSDEDGESSDSDDHLQSSDAMKSPALIEVQEEESEAVQDEENHILFGSLSSNLNNQTDENVITLRNMDSGKEPHSKGDQVESTEAEMEDGGLAGFAAKPKKPVKGSDEEGSFNPRGPNFLPLEPSPEAEKVDLKHQDVDEKKNAEEWMVDYALRQVVTKLGPARKRKVALLVEAFEKVMPVTKCDLQVQHGPMFDQARPVQSCN